MKESIDKKIRVAHLSSVHPWKDTRIFLKMCRTLSTHGFDVTLVARAEKEQILDGVTIIPFPLFDSKIKRFLIAPWVMYRMARKLKSIQVYHLHDPELIITAILLRLHGKKVIYDVHEDTPETMATKDYLHPAAAFILYYITWIAEWLAGKVVNHVIVVIPSIKKRFPSYKTDLVQNYALTDELSRGSAKTTGTSRKKQIIYVGDITRVRGVKEAIQAMELLPESLGAEFVLGGNFSEPGFEAELRAMEGWRKVRYLGFISRDRMSEELAQSMAGVNLMHPRPDHYGAQPNKIFEYMSAGLPVIVSNFPMMSTIVEESNCGMAVDTFNISEIASAYQLIIDNEEMREQMGINGKRSVKEKYNWESQIPVLLQIYKKVIG